PGERRREQQPFAAAVVRVAEIAVDASARADELPADGIDRRDSNGMVEREHAPRDGEPDHAAVDAADAGLAPEPAIDGKPPEQMRAHRVRLRRVARVLEESARRCETCASGADRRRVFAAVLLLPAAPAAEGPSTAEIGRGQLDGGAPLARKPTAEMLLERPQPHAVAVDLEVRPGLVAVRVLDFTRERETRGEHRFGRRLLPGLQP